MQDHMRERARVNNKLVDSGCRSRDGTTGYGEQVNIRLGVTMVKLLLDTIKIGCSNNKHVALRCGGHARSRW